MYDKTCAGGLKNNFLKWLRIDFAITYGYSVVAGVAAETHDIELRLLWSSISVCWLSVLSLNGRPQLDHPAGEAPSAATWCNMLCSKCSGASHLTSYLWDWGHWLLMSLLTRAGSKKETIIWDHLGFEMKSRYIGQGTFRSQGYNNIMKRNVFAITFIHLQ